MGKKTIVITGFGSFDKYDRNPSQTVVENIQTNGICDIAPEFCLVTEILPVVYDDVDRIVNGLWDLHSPHLVVHVGVGYKKRTIGLEQQSFGRGYCYYDVKGHVPILNICSSCKPSPDPVIRSTLNCEEMAVNVANKLCRDSLEVLKIEKSDDPSRFLCGYTYYISLCHDPRRSLFIHIPEPDEVVTIDVIIRVVKEVISECLMHV
ncbi:hypothetical protein AB6A40_007252 [Gnathostoma spinigerum]|uniref:Pyroglutamyl-peptidase I n=1 Tax=Gnathostoma spinigerum TaxID=75299 RepID=A0ABD6EKN6_9BILA